MKHTSNLAYWKTLLGDLLLRVGTKLKMQVQFHPKSHEIVPTPPREIEVRRTYTGLTNYGQGVYTERSTTNNGYFEIKYRIDVQDLN